VINAYNILVGKSEEKRPVGRPGRRWEDNIRMHLKKKQDWMLWIGCILLRIRTRGGLCKHSNELSSSIKGVEFLD
jgi:hypothetical protein